MDFVITFVILATLKNYDWLEKKLWLTTAMQVILLMHLADLLMYVWLMLQIQLLQQTEPTGQQQLTRGICFVRPDASCWYHNTVHFCVFSLLITVLKYYQCIFLLCGRFNWEKNEIMHLRYFESMFGPEYIPSNLLFVAFWNWIVCRPSSLYICKCGSLTLLWLVFCRLMKLEAY